MDMLIPHACVFKQSWSPLLHSIVALFIIAIWAARLHNSLSVMDSQSGILPSHSFLLPDLDNTEAGDACHLSDNYHACGDRKATTANPAQTYHTQKTEIKWQFLHRTTCKAPVKTLCIMYAEPFRVNAVCRNHKLHALDDHQTDEKPL